MALIPYRKRDPLATLRNEMSRLFDSPFGAFPLLREESVVPSVDLSEDEHNIYVEADIPGFEQKDVNISLKGHSLLISAKREESKEEKKKNYYCCERFQGSLSRSIDLPSSIDEDKIEAKYKNGVLNVTLPKREEAKAKEIKVKVE